MSDLASDLQGTEDRLRAWRHSSARAGADEALGWALSWYEGMDLNLLAERRKGSCWIENPEYVQRRQERAFEIARYAETRFYIEGDDVQVPDEDEEAVVVEEGEVTSGGEEARDTGAGLGSEVVIAESGAAEDEDDDVDEHIQVEDSPSRIAKEKALAVARARLLHWGSRSMCRPMNLYGWLPRLVPRLLLMLLQLLHTPPSNLSSSYETKH